MANIEVKLRRGTTSQHAGFAGAEGEVTVDTDKDTLIVHTGGAAGSGVELRRKDDTIAGSEIDNDAVGTAQIAANAVTSTEIAANAVTSTEIAANAVTSTEIAADAVTPAKLDDTQTYTVNGLSSTSNIAITRAAEGPGLRLTYDAATDEVRDIFVDSNGAFQFTNVSGGGTTGTLMTLNDDGVLNIPLCPTFADNSAAVTGGLATNDVYKTSTGELRIVV